MFRTGLFVLALFSLTVPASASAQIGLHGVEQALSISVSPAHPAPGQIVSLRAQSSYVDLAKSTLRWQADGKVIASGEGEIEAEITAKGLGGQTDIFLEATTPEGLTVQSNASIIPTQVELFLSSDSYVPPFYRGRSLPASGTNLRAEAKAHLFQGSGAEIPAANIIYTWKRDGQAIPAASGKGKSSAVIPIGFGISRVTVEAQSADGTLSGEATQTVPLRDATVLLYKNHPLYGIMYNAAMPATAFVSDAEMTFTAVPYFAPVQNARDRALEYAWSVGGSPVPKDTKDPNEITINAKDSTGVALIDLTISHQSNYFFDAKGTWNVTFSAAASSGDTFHLSQ